MRKTIYISDKTNDMIEALKNEAVEKYSIKYGIEKALIQAVIKKESENNPFAIRIEHHLKKAEWYRNTLAYLKKELIKDYHYCSFGYMQIMFGTARHIGYLGKAFSLFNPDKAIKFGTKYLKQCIKRYKGKIWDGVAAYNQGNNRFYDLNKNGIKDEGEKYRNQDYVDKVKKIYKSFGGVI